jgi:hypothetical protein
MQRNLTKLNEIAEQQFHDNSYKNLFCTKGNQLHFNRTTIREINLIREELLNLSNVDKNVLLMNLSRRFVKTLYQTDPYINFSDKDNLIIQKIYSLLLCDITSEFLIDVIEKRHFQRICMLVKETNPAVYQINHNSNRDAQHFVYAEYSPEFQLNLLKIDSSFLLDPILDLGCGEHGCLVEYLRAQHLTAYGADRLQQNRDYYFKCDWLEFIYGDQKWGTIISHLSFTSHFLHHFLQNDGIDILYAGTYMKILKSLAAGGRWIYTPSVPFIENLLPQSEYHVNRTLVDRGINKTVITKL